MGTVSALHPTAGREIIPALSVTRADPGLNDTASAPRRGWLWALGGVLAMAASLSAIRLFSIDRYLLDFVAWVRGEGTAGMVVFVVSYAIACVLLLPVFILTLGAGFAYGVATGVPLVWMGASLGATAAFFVGRTVARGWVAARIAGNPRFVAIDRAVGHQGLKIVSLSRLSPAFPFTLLNYAYGLTRVRPLDYVIGTTGGMLPGVWLYVYLGSLLTSVTEIASGRAEASRAQQAFYFLGLAATVAVMVVVTRVARRALAEATTDAAKPAEKAARAPVHEVAVPLVRPDDAHNRRLLAEVHPPEHRNPIPAGRYNLAVLGGGTAGLVSAAGAAGLGARVALVERHLLGGDCLNVGCVPSKALIAAARSAAAARGASALGVHVAGVAVDFPAVMERMRRLRADLAPTDGVARLTRLGVDVYLGAARFTGPSTVEVDGRRLEFARAVIATGARAAAPPIPGLADVGYLTNETVFSLTALPPRLVVIGAGPIGCELAQAFAAFGSAVTVVDAGTHVLPREDADAADIVARRLRADGVTLVHEAQLTRVERRGDDAVVHYVREGASHAVACDVILVAAGRTPNLEGLDLEAAGVAHGEKGVVVDDHLRTTNRRVWAAGDVAGRHQFTHTADAQARIVLTNALFLGRRRVSALHVPWCTYTTPEVAHVGLYAHEAEKRGIAIDTLTLPLHEVDRARLEGEDEGFLRVHLVKGRDRLVGATLVATHAGDMISELTLAMAGKIGLGALANVIHPYPTQAEAIRKAGDAYNRTRLTPTVRRLFDWWLRLRR